MMFARLTATSATPAELIGFWSSSRSRWDHFCADRGLSSCGLILVLLFLSLQSSFPEHQHSNTFLTAGHLWRKILPQRRNKIQGLSAQSPSFTATGSASSRCSPAVGTLP